MRQLPTGEPCAGELHARFGGRGERRLFSTPISLIKHLDPRLRGDDNFLEVLFCWLCWH